MSNYFFKSFLNYHNFKAAIVFFAVIFTWSVLFTPDVSIAQAFLDSALSKGDDIRATIFKSVYILGGIGIAVLALMAFFGKFSWAKLLMIAGGLFLVGVSDAVITYFGEGNIVR